MINLSGEPAALDHRDGPVQFEVDLDFGEAATGMPVAVQVLRPDEVRTRAIGI